MVPANVPTYSVTRLEKLAAECLAEKLSAVSPPIDVEYLLETEPGLLLDILPGLESRFGVNGVVYRRGPEEYLVVIDADLADRPNSHRYRFTGFDRPTEVLDALRRELSHEFRVSRESMGYRMKNWPVTVVGQVERSLRQRSATADEPRWRSS